MFTMARQNYRHVNYERMTGLELAADLERWASVRDRISLRREHEEGYGRSLQSGNLLEAARRLQNDHEHIKEAFEDNEKVRLCPTCSKLQDDMLIEADERVS